MREFETLSELSDFLQSDHVQQIAVQSVDLTQIAARILDIRFTDCLFLGCHLNEALRDHLGDENFLFPVLNFPFNVYPPKLYNKESLYHGYEPDRPESYEQTLDKIVYDHYIKTGKETNAIKETLARRLHDHSITDALQEFISTYPERKLVAIMGGHGLSRTSQSYRQLVEISRELTQRGYLMISGGGPGAMEATHVGAWFADKPEADLRIAMDVLAQAPQYDHPEWLPSAFKVLRDFPEASYPSLGIPTWLYGHEPPTPFATHIAKYFANSVREEGLLAIAKGGVIYAPGSAGTMQEIFQDIAQNHYESFGYASPMVFLNHQYWTQERPVYPVIAHMAQRGDLNHLDLGLYDTNAEVIDHIEAFG
ncbi:MAG: hypothetical protein AAF206_24825 [Bacteroidota bacterium]